MGSTDFSMENQFGRVVFFFFYKKACTTIPVSFFFFGGVGIVMYGLGIPRITVEVGFAHESLPPPSC
jgi:hypothetical protein